MNPRDHRPYETNEDIVTHLADESELYLGAVIPPIFQNTIFADPYKGDPWPDPNVKRYGYTRIDNPTVDVAERKIAALEKGEKGICFSSGMAAISAAIYHFIERDSHVVCIRNCYPSTKYFLADLAKFGVTVTYVVGDTIEEFEQAIQPNTKLIYLESPSSYRFYMQDLKAVADLAKSKGIATFIDNSWATPLYQNPITMGIDIVMHTISKYIGGHSDVTGGVLVGKKDLMESFMGNERANFGACMDPHQAWLVTRSLRTLPIRMKQHQDSALAVARYLEAHPKVERVVHPGLPSHPQHDLFKKQFTGSSGLFAVIPKGDPDDIQQFINHLQYFNQCVSWGGFEGIISGIGVRLTPEQAIEMGYPQRTIRLSIGLENTDTIIDDFERAFVHIKL